MKDPSVLENELLSEIAAAKDEAAVEAIRIAALGRSGSVSALLKTLGAMTPEQRREQGPLIHRLVHATIGGPTVVCMAEGGER